jgi:hypothetical protein
MVIMELNPRYKLGEMLTVFFTVKETDDGTHILTVNARDLDRILVRPWSVWTRAHKSLDVATLRDDGSVNMFRTISCVCEWENPEVGKILTHEFNQRDLRAFEELAGRFNLTPSSKLRKRKGPSWQR